MANRALRRLRARVQDDRGVTLVLMALLMVAMLVIVAIVVDIALIRSDRRTNQSVTDFAATAGVRELGGDPWAGVCTALDYLAAQDSEFSGLTLSYSDGDSPISGDPCASPGTHADCALGDLDTWAVLTGTSSDGLITVNIESPYDPAGDSAFSASESAHAGDPGEPCEQVAVKVFETKNPTFSRVIGAGSITSGVRSVARRDAGPGQEPAALILLERHDCNTLQTGGSGTRVVAQAQADKPGIIQIDSDARGQCNAQTIINGQAVPTVVACSNLQTFFGCTNAGSVTQPRESVIGVFAALVNPGGNIAPPYSDNTYGDTEYQPAEQFTRGPVDERYGDFVLELEGRLSVMFSGSALTPPGCGPVNASGRCNDGARTWRVLSGADCPPAAAQAAGAAETNLWFACGNYNLNAPIALPVTERVVFNGAVRVQALFHVPNAREVLIKGKATGNDIGLEVANGGILRLNNGTAASCAAANPANQNVLAVFDGRYDVGSGGDVLSCDTFAFLASGGDKVPTDSSTGLIDAGTAPCPSTDNTAPCDAYRGNVRVSSGATIDWSARDELDIPFCRPDLVAAICYNPADPAFKFEDLGLWVEAATGNDINGGGGLSLEGVFFMPNAKPFKIAGGSAQVIELNAQFIVRELHASGGAIINLVPDPNDALTLPTPDIGLVR